MGCYRQPHAGIPRRACRGGRKGPGGGPPAPARRASPARFFRRVGARTYPPDYMRKTARFSRLQILQKTQCLCGVPDLCSSIKDRLVFDGRAADSKSPLTDPLHRPPPEPPSAGLRSPSLCPPSRIGSPPLPALAAVVGGTGPVHAAPRLYRGVLDCQDVGDPARASGGRRKALGSVLRQSMPALRAHRRKKWKPLRGQR